MSAVVFGAVAFAWLGTLYIVLGLAHEVEMLEQKQKKPGGNPAKSPSHQRKESIWRV